MKTNENNVVFEQLLITAPAKRSKKAVVPSERIVSPVQFQMIDIPGFGYVDPLSVNYIRASEFGTAGGMLKIGINSYNSGIKCSSPEEARLLEKSISAKCNIARLGRAALVSETTAELLNLLRQAVLNDSGWKEKAKVLLTGEYPV